MTAEELKLPVVPRRGVNLEFYRQILRDPKDPRVGEFIYKHSYPAELVFVQPNILGLLTFDPTLMDGRYSSPESIP